MSAAGSFRGKGDCGRDASNRGKQKWLVALEGKKKNSTSTSSFRLLSSSFFLKTRDRRHEGRETERGSSPPPPRFPLLFSLRSNFFFLGLQKTGCRAPGKRKSNSKKEKTVFFCFLPLSSFFLSRLGEEGTLARSKEKKVPRNALRCVLTLSHYGPLSSLNTGRVRAPPFLLDFLISLPSPSKKLAFEERELKRR